MWVDISLRRLITITLLILVAFFVWTEQLLSGQVTLLSGTSDPLLTVTFLDIGQGDAILIETPDGVQALIDGGPDASVLRELTSALPRFDRTLDLVLSTHPDKDHIGGLVDVLERYQVEHIITTENTGETLAANAYLDALLAEDVPVTYARAGQIFALGASTTLTILSPASNPSMLESNTSSIVILLRYGEVEFLLTGDAPIAIEEYLVNVYGTQLASEVLKLGHHGSRTSTSAKFLEMVAPQYAVVSAGRDNSYGHPHSEVVDKVAVSGATLLSTQNDGSVTLVTDGIKVWQQ